MAMLNHHTPYFSKATKESSTAPPSPGPSCHVGTTSTPPHPRLLSTPKRPPPPLSAYLEPQGFGGLWLGSGIERVALLHNTLCPRSPNRRRFQVSGWPLVG
ncbi:hypothetical protein TsFJ059_009980 [Trichoderma semiorbis]|uniref:Uncharacterized protein n=1 Tax=Trichoderma semiorbis TaxID=1491008 RepID=A0A9P8KU15_9HYPO|nr:hypothetical protein TsFJ059_009980 [Trichoderma semiorbis]